MKLITVIPLARGIFKDTLTYWSGKELSPGAIVVIPVRNRRVNALVVSVEEVENAKANIKNAPFVLKKVESVKPNFLLPEFVRAAKRAARYFATGTGSVLQSFIPKAALDAPVGNGASKSFTSKEPLRLKIEKLAFQSEDAERLSAYRILVREEFARSASVFICFPTVEEVERAAKTFEKGIKEYTFVFHGKEPRKKMLEGWRQAIAEKHPIVILATASFLGLPRKDLKTFIVERENSYFYRTISRPEIDIRTFAEIYAEERGAKIIFGDNFLRTETLYRYQERELSLFTAVKFHSLATAEGAVIDMKKYRKGAIGSLSIQANEKTFTTLSNELKALIELSRRERGRMVIIVGRRGIAGTTVCGDCGTEVACEKCGAPLVLHEKKEKRYFLCHKCGSERTLGRGNEERCKHCGSWRLTPLGVGIGRVAVDLAAEFPSITVFRADSDTAKNKRVIRKTVSLFYNTQGTILLGTEMVIPYLEKAFTESALIGIDSLLTIPDFRINEKIFSLILSLRAKTRRTILVQTQESERKFFDYALRGDLLSFYREEIAERKLFGYPPFYVLIKISWETKPERADKEAKEMTDRLSGYAVRSYVSALSGVRGGVRAHALIKIPRGKWVNEKLLGILKGLPPRYTVSVDPESVL
mgnify:FL=1